MDVKEGEMEMDVVGKMGGGWEVEKGVREKGQFFFNLVIGLGWLDAN